MAKNDNRAPESPAQAAPAAIDLSAIEAKLGPIDEFRGRAESWMKEITAQVARLAGRSEEEERRKGALDKRLNDIEDRMQSLLTLTEMVSSSKNPFAGPKRETEAAPTPPAESAPTAPAAALASPEPAETPEVPPGSAEPTVQETPQQQPPAPAASKPVRSRAHPNDAMADPGAAPSYPHGDREPIEVRSVADTFPQRSAGSPGGPRSNANHRFFVLEWARLLAPVSNRIDLSGFLGFYVESGWVTPQMAATVRNLTLQLGRAAKDADNGMALDEIHARSILLIGRLQGSAPRPEAARATLMDAREVASGAWATIQR